MSVGSQWVYNCASCSLPPLSQGLFGILVLYFLQGCSANNIWVDTLFPPSCCSHDCGYWSSNFAIFFLIQAIFCTYSPVFDCTELYLSCPCCARSITSNVKKLLHQTLNNYTILLYYILNKQRLGRTSCVKGLKRT